MWRDFFGKKTEPSAAVANALADLDRLARDRSELGGPARTMTAVMAAAFGAAPRLRRAYRVDADFPWVAGVPAFAAHPPDFDPGDLRDRSSAIARALKSDNPAASMLMRADLGWDDLAASFARGDEGGMDDLAGAIRVPRDLLTSVVRLSVLPVLSACSEQLAPHRPETAADSGACPNCGRPPSLAEARGLEGQRFLRCGTCAADWPAPRLACVACGEKSAKAIRSLFVEGEESRHRLVICDACGFRLKVVSTLGPLSAPGLVVAELATVHLDFIP